MPVQKVDSGYRYGKTGKIYKRKADIRNKEWFNDF